MEPFELGEWRIDPASREIRSCDGSTRVSPKAMQVMEVLVGAGGDVIRRDDLLDAVWGDVIVGEEVLTHAIAELRRALCDSARQPRYIETVHKAGYRLREAPAVRAAGNKETAPTCTDAFDVSGYCECLRARALFERGGRQNVLAAIETYRNAGPQAASSARVLAELAETLSFLFLYYEPDTQHLKDAFDLTERAIVLDPGHAHAHAVHGFVLSIHGRRAAALKSFGKALSRQPEGFAPHYLLGRAMVADGNLAAAASLLERAAQVRPDDFHALVIASACYRGIGDPAAAQRASRAALARIEAFLQAYPGDMRALCGKTRSLAELSEYGTAVDLVRDASPADDPLQYYFVDVLAQAGETDRALDALERVIDAGWSHGAWLRADPDLEPLRRLPRFQRLQRALRVH